MHKKSFPVLKKKQYDDLAIFEKDIELVADGRFFQEINGDPMHYSLKTDGLTLALGFSVIDRLRAAQRNRRNLDAELDAILEPITALDDTAKVILSALTVTMIDNRYDHDAISASLVKGFSTLQNPSQVQFNVFAGLVKRRPQCVMDAACALCLSGSNQPNFDWVKNALIIVGKNRYTWEKMADNVKSWLSAYSLSPERCTFLHPSRDPQEKVREEREKNHKEIDARLHALSTNEQMILRDLQEKKGDLNALSRLALLLLAGKPLAPFARSLLNWSFSDALNSDFNAPHKEFTHLVSLNRVDWSQTRMALLHACAPLREANVSRTGKWALACLLRATGHPDDGKEEHALVVDLTKDRPHQEHWSILEMYCTTDPCDPASEQPENITETADKYALIDVCNLQQNRGISKEFHFFDMARPSVARFKPEVAIAKHREFASDVLTRTGVPLRNGLLELHNHNALLSIKEAHELVKKSSEIKAARDENLLIDEESWITSQYCLLLSFPFLSAQEQADALLQKNADERILLNLLCLAKPLEEKEFEHLLEKACRENDAREQYSLLTLAQYSSVQLSPNTRNKIVALFQSGPKHVRRQAFGVITRSGNSELLGEVVKSGWKATDAERESAFEAWDGSMSLLEAASRGLIAHDDAIDRISMSLYGHAVVMLNDIDVTRNIARRIDAAINKTTGLADDIIAPKIDIQLDVFHPLCHRLFRVTEQQPETNYLRDTMERMLENNKSFEQRQKRNHETFIAFKTSLTEAKANIILEYLSLTEFATIVEKEEDLANRWYGLFMTIANNKLPAVYNLILLMAYALGAKSPNKSRELLLRVKDSKPLVTFTTGKACVQFDAMSTWAGVRNSVLDNLRLSRLDYACNDHDLSIEVLAALFSGKQQLLTTYIEEKLRKEEPAEVSRGIMVAGFSDQNNFTDEIIKRYECYSGLIGNAQKAAKYAYERNVWARHWYDKMCHTDENTDFWRYAVLFLKIVDGRYDVWYASYKQEGHPIQLFLPTINSKIKNRIERWESLRNTKLFGSDAPLPIFLKERTNQ